MAFFHGKIHEIEPEMVEAVNTLLDYVERMNKQDEDPQIADCAAKVEKYINDYEQHTDI